MFLAGLVQLGDEQSPATVLGENQVTVSSEPQTVAPLVEITTAEPTAVPDVTGLIDETGNGTLTGVLKQPKTVNKIPTWTIILISLLGAVIVFGILGLVLHKFGKRNRAARARRWVNQQDLLNAGNP